MIITQDTIAEFCAEAGRPYVFSASGDFGGGTISLQWEDRDEWTTFPACHLIAEATRVVTAPTCKLRFLIADTSSPNISAHVVPTSVSLENEEDSSHPRVLPVVDAAERLALTSQQVRFGDIVAEIGTRQITQVTCVGDAGASLNSCYFLISDQAGQTYVWLDVDGQGSDPGASDRGIQVSIAQDASASEVALAVAAAFVGVAEYSSVGEAGDIVTFTNADNALHDEAFDDGGTGFAIETHQYGVDRGGMFIVADLGALSVETGWQPIPRLASDWETQVGSETGRAVSPSTLSSWWQWIKSQAQSISGARTWGGNQTLNGTNNTMPNQSALSSGSSLVNRSLLTNELIWSAPRLVDFDLASSAFVTTANASGYVAPGQISLTLAGGAVNGNYSVGTIFRELGCAEAGGGTPNFGTHFFLYFRLSGAFVANTTFRILVGVVAGKTGNLDDKGIGLRLTSDTTAVAMIHNGTTLTESSAFTVTNYGGHRNFLLENVGNGTVNLYYVGSSEGARFPATPSATLTGGPTTGIGGGSGKHCVVAQYLATGTTALNTNAHLVAAKAYWP
ncbi:hypothetical protein BH09VER1_BH09VER1_49490 [soil metagenome]